MFPRLVCQKPRGPFGVLYLHMMSQPVKKARYKNCFGSFLPALNASTCSAVRRFPPQFLFPARLSHDTALFFALCLSRCVRSLVRYDTARDWGCRCCDAVLSRDESKRGRALASLREDPGLQQLLPHLCTFIQSKVSCVSSNIQSKKVCTFIQVQGVYCT